MLTPYYPGDRYFLIPPTRAQHMIASGEFDLNDWGPMETHYDHLTRAQQIARDLEELIG
jgi:hypothetical protein